MKGKQGYAAAVRHEIAVRDAAIAEAQRTAAKLAAENEALRDRLVTQEREAGAQLRELREQVHVAASPRVRELETELVARSHDRDKWRDEFVAIQERRSRELDRLIRHFEDGHGLKGKAALEAAIGLLEPRLAGKRLVEGSELDHLAHLPLGVAEMIERRQGKR